MQERLASFRLSLDSRPEGRVVGSGRMAGLPQATFADVSAAAVGQQARYLWSWYDEPARWAANCDVEEGYFEGCYLPPVNFVRNTVEWTPDPSCTIAPGSTAWLGSEIS